VVHASTPTQANGKSDRQHQNNEFASHDIISLKVLL